MKRLCLAASLFWFASGAATAAELIQDKGWQQVNAHCSACHSIKLVTGNRGDRQTWLETIRWMQASQNFWQLDSQTEDQILTYLAKNYPPAEAQRRPALPPTLLP